eukprot:3869904-Prymnesium_polylepis.1
MAVSKNGSWSREACGVVLSDDAIKGGVYPALSASACTLRCRLTDGALRGHGPRFKLGQSLRQGACSHESNKPALRN